LWQAIDRQAKGKTFSIHGPLIILNSYLNKLNWDIHQPLVDRFAATLMLERIEKISLFGSRFQWYNLTTTLTPGKWMQYYFLG